MILYIIPFISAFIGWSTNWIAIKMLFHPKQPVRILGLSIQGIFPRKQKEFAEKLGTIVGKELINIGELTSRIQQPENINHVLPTISSHIDQFLHHKLKEKLPVISMFMGDGMLQKVKEGLMEEIQVLLPNVLSEFSDKLSQEIDVEKIVQEKVMLFSSDKLESIIFGIMRKEFKFVEIIGGVLGFMIGLVQVVITVFMID